MSCDNQVYTFAIPGPAGSGGTPGVNGTDGVNAFTTTTASFVMPAEGANVTIAVVTSVWVGLGQVVFIVVGGSVGWFSVVATPTATSLTVQNLKDTATGVYVGNSVPGTVFASGATISPGGLQGPAGTASGTAFQIANNLSEGVPATLRTNMGLGSLAVLNTVNGGNWSGTDLAVADGGTGSSTAAAARAALGLAIGTNVQTQDATLQSISALGTVANRMIYTTGVDTWAELVMGAVGGPLITAGTYQQARGIYLGGLKRGYGVLAAKYAIDLNSATTDNAVTVDAFVVYRIIKIVVVSPSVNMTTATLGVFTAAGGAGTTIAADQSLAGLTATTKVINLTLTSIVNTDVLSSLTLYIRCGTAQGVAATASVYIFGEAFDGFD